MFRKLNTPGQVARHLQAILLIGLLGFASMAMAVEITLTYTEDGVEKTLTFDENSSEADLAKAAVLIEAGGATGATNVTGTAASLATLAASITSKASSAGNAASIGNVIIAASDPAAATAISTAVNNVVASTTFPSTATTFSFIAPTSGSESDSASHTGNTTTGGGRATNTPPV